MSHRGGSVPTATEPETVESGRVCDSQRAHSNINKRSEKTIETLNPGDNRTIASKVVLDSIDKAVHKHIA